MLKASATAGVKRIKNFKFTSSKNAFLSSPIAPNVPILPDKFTTKNFDAFCKPQHIMERNH